MYIDQKNLGSDGATYDISHIMIHTSVDNVMVREDDATARVFSDERTVTNLHHGMGDRT